VSRGPVFKIPLKFGISYAKKNGQILNPRGRIMQNDIYEQLREQVDQYSVGFPRTESGVEMKILRRLFTEEEARMYLNLSLMLETPRAVAGRLKQDPDRVADILENMEAKGTLFCVKKGNVKYAVAPFVVGFFEFQLNRLDREFASLVDQYMEEAFGREMSNKTVPMRAIPVNRAIQVSWPVAPYEDVRQIIKGKKKIAVANCICRTQKGLLDDGCDKPLETCFMFGSHADYYVDHKMGRWIDQEEALRILDQCDEAGLVPQPYNAQNPGGLCNCCGDCCGILRALKKHPRPAEMTVSNYFAAVDGDLCAGCETCLDRCQMGAITMGEEAVARINLDRCIGCGLCVTTCTTGAMSLQPKQGEDRREPPVTGRDTMMKMANERGKTLIPLAYTRGS
jgi:electron transport complex protein RnfB